MKHDLKAKRLVGCRFRSQGRNAKLGLDCIGVVALTYGIPLASVPSDYRLRGDRMGDLIAGLRHFFRQIAIGKAQAGDLLLCAPAADQLHLAIKTERGFIHADARLRRVVETPGAPPWRVLHAFRRRVKSKG